MSDFHEENRQMLGGGERKGLESQLREKLHVFPFVAHKLLGATSNYLRDTGSNSGINSGSFRLLESYNNAVFKFSPDNGNAVVVKIFPEDDDGRGRFETESEGRKFIIENGNFYSNGDVIIPKQLYKDDENRAIILEKINNLDDSYPHSGIGEKGDKRISLITSFLVQLNEIRATPENHKKFPYKSRYAYASSYEIYQSAVKRVQSFKDWIANGVNSQPAIIKWCKNNDLFDIIENHFNIALTIIDPQILHRQNDPSEMRFNWGDVSLPNLPIRKIEGRSQLVPLDLEYAGWDHFSGGITSLLLHHRSEDLSINIKQDLLNKFVADSRLGEDEQRELDARLIVGELLFVSRKLIAATKGLRETGLNVHRGPYQTIESVKIEELLEPALIRSKRGFLRASV